MNNHIHTVLTTACGNCGCAVRYCHVCQASDEYETPQEGCRDNLCGCHTDSRHELKEEVQS